MRLKQALIWCLTILCLSTPSRAQESAFIPCGTRIAVTENPLEDISVLLNVNFVMARGEVIQVSP